MKHAQGLIKQHEIARLALHEEKNIPYAEMNFLMDANDTLVDCRNTLRWTYAYAYFCISTKNLGKKEQFEFDQTNLENYTQRIHELVMIDKTKFLDPEDIDKREFYLWRDKLVPLFEAVKKFRKAVVESIESDDMQNEIN